MISSTSQRLPCKTCGLFDSGFAGDADYITSPGLNAPAADALSDFGLESQGPEPDVKPGMEKPSQIDNTSTWFSDLDDLSGDPLGDDSMEAFVNLDKFLSGNSFFDEDGNLIGSDGEFAVPKDEAAAEVTPVINFVHQVKPEVVAETSVSNMANGMHSNNPVQPQSQNTKKKGKTTRKRKAPTSEGVKTSLYEIPAASIIPNIVADCLDHTSNNTELDHDYSSKRQRMCFLDGNNAPSTSGTKKTIVQPANEISQSDGNVQLDDSLDKQTIRRIKNNYASKRSREQRKQKFVEMDQEAEELVVRNQELREKIVELERIAKEMKAVLVAKMSGNSV